MVITVTFLVHSLTLPAMRYRILWLPEIKEGVNFDPMLLYSIYYLVFSGVTCKKSARNLKILARFQDFKILRNTSLASKGALAHRLQRRTACKFQSGHQGAPKWPMGSGKVSTPSTVGFYVFFMAAAFFMKDFA